MMRFLSKAAERPTNDAPLRVFISYASANRKEADEIADALADRGIDVLIDRRSLPFAEKWKGELEELIRRSDTVLWLVSGPSVTSRWVNWEIDHVTRLKKRLVPVRIDNISSKGLPEAIKERHLLSLLPSDEFDQQIEKLVETLLVPRAWVKMHTWLADEARRNGRLRGQDLKEAETWLLDQPAPAEPPTQAIKDLISGSRRLRTRNKNLVIAASLCGMILALGGAWYSNQQRLAALVQESKALALVSEQETAKGDAATALLLSLAALPDPEDRLGRPMVIDAQRSLYQALFTLREQSVLDGHEASLTYAEVSPDGRSILTASLDGTASLWAFDGRHISTLEGHGGPVNMARFSPDGSRILTISDDQSGMLWDVNGRQIARLRGHTQPLIFATFSGDSRYIVTTSADYTARLWSAVDGQWLRDFKGHRRDVVAADFSPDQTYVATASVDGTARLWPVDGGSEPIVLEGHEDRLRSIRFSPDGTFVATTSRDQRAILWTLDGKIHRELRGHEGVVNKVRFAPDASLAVTASDDNTAKIWDAATGTPVATLRGHESRVIDLDVSSDGSKILTAAVDGAIGLWKVGEGDAGLLAMLRGHDRDIAAARFSADGDWIISSSKDRTARVWLATEQPVFSKDLKHDCDVRSLAFGSDDRILATACKHGLVSIWDTEQGEVIASKDLSPKQIISLGFSTDGRSIALAHEDGTVTLRDLETLEQIGRDFAGHSARVRSVDFNSTDTEIVTSSADGTAKIWRGDTQEEIATLEGHSNRVRSAAFSRDDASVLTVSADRTVKLWNSRPGHLIRSFDHHSDDVWALGFSPDGQSFVSGSEDGQAFIGDVAGDRLPRALIGHGDNIRSAEFSHDGRYVLTSSWDRTVRLWDVETVNNLAVIPNDSIILDATFSPSGKQIAYLVRNIVRLRPIYATAEDLIDAAKEMKPRDLTSEERQIYLSD